MILIDVMNINNLNFHNSLFSIIKIYIIIKTIYLFVSNENLDHS